MASATQNSAKLAGPLRPAATLNTRPAALRWRSLTWLAAVTAAAVLAIGTAACSSPSSGPASTDSGSASGLLRYSECMRSHGITNFPDPGASGGLSVGSTAQVGSSGGNGGPGPNSPVYQAANQACHHLLLPGGSGSGGQGGAQNVATGVKLATCMRSHGFPSFPDPNSQDVFYIPSSINMNSAAYQSAFSTCHSKYQVSGARYSQQGPGAP